MKTEEVEKIKHGPADTGVDDLILRRWSPRSFSDREVKADDLRKIFEAAHWAASCFNEQPWRFLVGRRGDETYGKIFDALVEGNQLWVKTAPVLILSIAKKTFTHNSNPNRFGLHDTGAATATMGLQATALGFHTHSMAGFDVEKARASFNIPDDFEIGAVTVAGYLSDSSQLPDAQRTMEESPRVRRPLREFVFQAWEQPAQF